MFCEAICYWPSGGTLGIGKRRAGILLTMRTLSRAIGNKFPHSSLLCVCCVCVPVSLHSMSVRMYVHTHLCLLNVFCMNWPVANSLLQASFSRGSSESVWLQFPLWPAFLLRVPALGFRCFACSRSRTSASAATSLPASV